MDMTTDIGFANSLYQAANLKPGAAALAAPVCGSWVFMSRGSTGRSRSRPMGDLTCKSTRLGNLLCARTLVILWLCAAQSVWFVLEQPSSSLMELHCLFQRFIRRIPLRKLTIRMADFGSATAKPTILYSSHRAIDDLPSYKTARRLVEREMVRHYTNQKGEHRICGGKDLKSSQAYPRGFGQGMAKCRTRVLKSHGKMARSFARASQLSANKADTRKRVNSAWTKGAQLESVINFLSH